MASANKSVNPDAGAVVGDSPAAPVLASPKRLPTLPPVTSPLKPAPLSPSVSASANSPATLPALPSLSVPSESVVLLGPGRVPALRTPAPDTGKRRPSLATLPFPDAGPTGPVAAPPQSHPGGATSSAPLPLVSLLGEDAEDYDDDREVCPCTSFSDRACPLTVCVHVLAQEWDANRVLLTHHDLLPLPTSDVDAATAMAFAGSLTDGLNQYSHRLLYALTASCQAAAHGHAHFDDAAAAAQSADDAPVPMVAPALAASAALRGADGHAVSRGMSVSAGGRARRASVASTPPAAGPGAPDDRNELPVLCGYLDKMSPSFLVGWQTRYVAVADYNLYYAPDPYPLPGGLGGNVNGPVPREVNCVPLLVVKTISGLKGKKDECQFQVEAQDSKSGDLRNYLFKAGTVADRDRWVAGLSAHRDHFLKMLRRTAMNQGTLEVVAE